MPAGLESSASCNWLLVSRARLPGQTEYQQNWGGCSRLRRRLSCSRFCSSFPSGEVRRWDTRRAKQSFSTKGGDHSRSAQHTAPFSSFALRPRALQYYQLPRSYSLAASLEAALFLARRLCRPSTGGELHRV